MKNFAIVALLAVTGSANAQYSFTGSTITENFDAMIVGAASPFSFNNGVQANVPGIGFVGAKLSGTNVGPNNMPFVSDDGTSNSGGLRNHGANAAATDRALGALGSGSNVGAFGAAITNNSAGALTEFTLIFNSEQYRSSTSQQNFLTFAWGTSATAGLNDSNFLSNAGMTAFGAGDVIGDNPVTTNGVLNPPSVRSYNITVTGLNVLPGERVYIRWSDANDVGNDAALAIDDLSFSAIPTPGTTALLGLAGVAVLRRRRA